MSAEFEKEVLASLATLTERQTQQHTAIVERLDKVNGRLDKHDGEIKDLEAHKNRAIGYVTAIGGVITIVLFVLEYLHVQHVAAAVIKP